MTKPGSKQRGGKSSGSFDGDSDLTAMSIEEIIEQAELPQWDDRASLCCRSFPTLVANVLERYPAPAMACRCALLQGQAFVANDDKMHRFIETYSEVREKLLMDVNESELEWLSKRMKAPIIKTYPGRKTLYYFNIDNKVFFSGLGTQSDITEATLATVYITKSLLTSSQPLGRLGDALERTIIQAFYEWLDETIPKLDKILAEDGRG